ncbi:glycosyltransferase [Desulfacinum hydrothermale]|uniref:glycosyltransferase n=1 Tax=Desulfacinum hydrothermale TaxID=109258 RepID=UPI001483C275|nr:glycosyltransferase [Desulfacinum hydrothermale]
MIPEVYGPNLADLYGQGIKKVILNQSGYLTFRGYSWDAKSLTTPYGHPDVLATLVNSKNTEEYVRYAFPHHPVHRFRLSVDPKLFFYEPNKKKQIAFSRIKNPRDAMQVVSILKFRGVLGEFELRPFINIPQSEVARLLRESLIFLSFGYPEGFGLPAAEAMACGCIVVGFHGGGGREFFDPHFSYPIEQGDIIGFARTVEGVIRQYEADPAPLVDRGRRAAEYIAKTYSPQREEEDLLKAWNAVFLSVGKVLAP